MKGKIRVGLLAAMLALPAVGRADDPPPASISYGEESSRSFSVRAAYYPFLAVGHGILLVAQYGVGYPIYFFSKPAIDFIYSSTDEPTDVPSAAALNSRTLNNTRNQGRY